MAFTQSDAEPEAGADGEDQAEDAERQPLEHDHAAQSAARSTPTARTAPNSRVRSTTLGGERVGHAGRTISSTSTVRTPSGAKPRRTRPAK